MTGPPPELLRRKTLQLADLTVSFDGFKALDGLSLTVDAGELRCIIGPNGAGKTTMMDVVTGKTRPDRGSAWFGPDVNLLTLSEPEIAQAGIGRKFQKPTVFEQLTVFENLELALWGDKSFWKALIARLTSSERQHIDDVLDLIGLTGHRAVLAGTLSHGQKQWLEIGMLLMPEPERARGQGAQSVLRRQPHAVGRRSRRPGGRPNVSHGPQRHGEDHAAQVHHGSSAGDVRRDRLQRDRSAQTSRGRSRAPRDRLRAARSGDILASDGRGESARRPWRAREQREVDSAVRLRSVSHVEADAASAWRRPPRPAAAATGDRPRARARADAAH